MAEISVQMNIVFIAESVCGNEGGIQRVAYLIAQTLLDAFPDACEIIVAKKLPDSLTGVQLWSANGKKWLFWLKAFFAIRKADYVIYDHLGSMRIHHWAPARVKSIAFAHGIEVWPGTARPKRIKCAEKADFLITNSAYTKQRATQLIPSFARAAVCWLATVEEVEDVPPTQIVKMEQRDPLVLILGRMKSGRDKGHQKLIEIWNDVRLIVPDAQLCIVGTGDDSERLQKLRDAHGLSAAIKFTGYLSDQNVGELFTRAKLLCMPSVGEGFGLVYIEAMRHAVPVIASRQDAGQEVNQDAVTGFNVDIEDRQALIDGISTILRDGQLAQAMSDAAYERWLKHFSYASFSRRFVEIVHKCMGPQ